MRCCIITQRLLSKGIVAGFSWRKKIKELTINMVEIVANIDPMQAGPYTI
jgi:hypothetical protein